jgi:hypothetical protein
MCLGTSGAGCRSSTMTNTTAKTAAPARQDKVTGGRLHKAVHSEHARRGHEQPAADIDAVAHPEAVVVVNQGQGDDGGGDTERQVDEEDPMPAERLGQDPTNEQTDSTPGGTDEGVDAHRFGPLEGLGVEVDEDPEDHGAFDGRADALDEAGGGEQEGTVRQSAQHRRHGEEDHAGDEDLLASHQIAEPAGHQ